MVNWIKSHEASLATLAGALGAFLATTLTQAQVHEVLLFGTMIGSAAHLVWKVVEAFTKAAGGTD